MTSSSPGYAWRMVWPEHHAFWWGPLSDSENARDRKFRILLATGDNRKEAHNRQIKIKLKPLLLRANHPHFQLLHRCLWLVSSVVLIATGLN